MSLPGDWFRALLNLGTPEDGEGGIEYEDADGYTLDIPGNLVNQAGLADRLDAAAEEDTLHGYTWVLGVEAVRGIIDLAHSEPDPEIVLLTLLAHTRDYSDHDDDDVDGGA